MTLEMSRSLIHDKSSGREFNVAVGGGVMAFNPSRNLFFFDESDVPQDEEPTRELDLVVDPILSFGVGLRFPLDSRLALRADFRDNVQFCDSGDPGSLHYLCPGWAIRQHYDLSMGIEFPL
ncbi:MAG: hypothetical protein H0W36_01015 [Gemmatimonadetes bacterium]|nr:hypothetical protein [Gemmatimonadota bacterium]